MPRKNRNVGRPNSASRRLAEKGQRPFEPSITEQQRRRPVEAIVIPDGKCMRNHRKPKARFATEEKARRALKQAQEDRRRIGSGHVERRFYYCDNCDGYHLTSTEAPHIRGGDEK